MAQELTYETVYSAISTVRELIADKWVQTPQPNTFLMHHIENGYIEREMFWKTIEAAEELNQIPGWAGEAYLVHENKYLGIANIIAEADIIGEYRLWEWLDQKVREMNRQANRFCDKLCAAHCDKNGKVVDER